MENRIIDLEVKFTYQEDLLEQLNKIVTKQQFTIDKLTNELKAIRSSVEQAGSVGGQSKNLKDEVPPHY